MAANLEIRNGTPYWWDSPDIWAVPGTDPNGVPGQPIAGQQAFLWARVHNTGEDPVVSAVVNFYWSNPAAGVLRSNSTFVGSAFVDLDVSDTKEVLCVIPWIPVIVNGGHECIVAEIIHTSDPLPTPLPDPFSPPQYHQVAQKNINVLEMAKTKMVFPIQIAAPQREEKKIHVSTEIGGTLGDQSLGQLGIKGFRPMKDCIVKTGLSMEPGCDNSVLKGEESYIEIYAVKKTYRAVFLTIYPPKLKDKSYALLRVIARDEEDNIYGGMTYCIINSREG